VAEEFGLITCLFVMVVLFFIVSRVIKYAINEKDLFAKLATIGLASQIALQSLVNIAVSIGMLPTKGMTIPFISYGGSSLVAVSIGFGIILALTKRKYDDKLNYDNLLIN
jgi:cell division protein FtsW